FPDGELLKPHLLVEVHRRGRWQNAGSGLLQIFDTGRVFHGSIPSLSSSYNTSTSIPLVPHGYRPRCPPFRSPAAGRQISFTVNSSFFAGSRRSNRSKRARTRITVTPYCSGGKKGF